MRSCGLLNLTIMIKFIKSSQGFGLIGILIVIAVIILAGGGGLYWNETKKQQSIFETGADAVKRAEELKRQIESRQEQIYGGRTSINIEQIRNASFESAFFKKVVTLRAGLYSEKPITNSAIVATAQIYDDKIAFGDIDGDGIFDALAVVTEYGGGSGSFRSLVAFENDGGTPLYIARADLGDRTIINSIKIESGIVVLDMIVQGPNDGMCCPTLHERRSYQLVGNQLKEVIVGDTSNWKTYRNEKYGFEVKYPGNLFPKILNNGIVLYRQEPVADTEYTSLSFLVNSNPAKLSSEEYFDGDPGVNLYGNTEEKNIVDMVIGGRRGIKFDPFISFAGGEEIIIPIEAAFITIFDNGGTFKADGSLDIILSTLQFD